MKFLHLLIALAIINLIVIVGVVMAQPLGTVTDSQCIVTVKNIRFDVSLFRHIHSGGDIFVCGTDMTKIFFEQHQDQMLEQMQRYKIN